MIFLIREFHIQRAWSDKESFKFISVSLENEYQMDFKKSVIFAVMSFLPKVINIQTNSQNYGVIIVFFLNWTFHRGKTNFVNVWNVNICCIFASVKFANLLEVRRKIQ